jgi:hypothetical protein
MGSPLSHINVFILSPSVEIATFQLTAWLTDSTRFRLSLPVACMREAYELAR